MLLTNGRGVIKDVTGEKEKQLKELGWKELKQVAKSTNQKDVPKKETNQKDVPKKEGK